MKRYFFAGLFILLPFTLTLLIVSVVVNILTRPFQQAMASTLNHYSVFDQPLLFISPESIVVFFSKLFVLFLLVTLVFLIGFLGQLVMLTSLMRLGVALIQRIPMVNTIYNGLQSIVKAFFDSQDTHTFSQVALVPFPYDGGYSIGLISQLSQLNEATNSVNVFVPTAPNPTIGYMLMFKPSEIVLVDMKVDDAIKCVVSCGIMFPKEVLSKEVLNDS